LRSTRVLLLFTVVILLVCTTEKVKVSASGTGIGIRLDGPEQAVVNQTIYYTITVINLGDYWDKNLKVTNRFPDGTILSWNVPDLAPLLKPGHTYSITPIPYMIKTGDVLPSSPPCIDDVAQVTGYTNVSGLQSSVQAETDFLTIIIARPPPSVVGGYSVLLEPKRLQSPCTSINVSSLFAIIAVSVYLLFQSTKNKDLKNAFTRG
jgi:uncharacterized repeat protein (TIGR01451 family)